MKPLVLTTIGISGLAAAILPGCSAEQRRSSVDTAPPSFTIADLSGQIVGMRRLTETQYRNSIAEIFGPDITVAGRFEPIVRPGHELIASGASDASISPAGLEQFDAIGRNIAAQVFDDVHRGQFAGCTPTDKTRADAACATQVLTPLGRYLFRRPLSQTEQAYYVRVAGAAAVSAGSFYKGLELALASMLVSPRFLYVIETAEGDPDNPGAIRLDNYSRAARVSFMLWDTTPNEEMLRAAGAGELTDQTRLGVIVQRMVNSPRFERGVRAFFSDMLLFEKFAEIAKDPVIYPYFNQSVAEALPEQTLRTIVDHLLTRGGDYRELFTTPRTFITRALGGLYGVQVHQSKGWEPHEFKPGDDRAGLLGQAGFLALYSHSGRSSPTLRGRAIREVLMCQPVPNPPGNVNFTAVQDTTNQAMPTARIRLTMHNTDPVCAACHQITDPIGLALERFDGIGAVRTRENGSDIDIAGEMDGSDFFGAAGLGKALAASSDTTQCVASRALEYAVGKPVEDAKTVEKLERGFASDGYDIRALFLQALTMPESWHVETEPLGTEPLRISLINRKR